MPSNNLDQPSLALPISDTSASLITASTSSLLSQSYSFTTTTPSYLPTLNLDEDKEPQELARQERPEQSVFRKRLLEVYKSQCLVTGSTLCLEAAHIKPYAECEDGSEDRCSLANGLLLAPDLHRLFDAGHWTVIQGEGESLVIQMSEAMCQLRDYANYNGKQLGWFSDELMLLVKQTVNFQYFQHHQVSLPLLS